MTDTVHEDTTSRSRRKGTLLGLVAVAWIVAVMLAITSFVTHAAALLWVALVVAGAAAVLFVVARQAGTHRPPKQELP